MPKTKDNLFFCGRKIMVDEEGRLVTSSSRSGWSAGKYGEDTVTVRVPVSLMPLLQHILLTLEGIEQVRRNIEGNVLNTTPELFGCDTLKKVYSEDWRRAVAYAMRASTNYAKREKAKQGEDRDRQTHSGKGVRSIREERTPANEPAK